MWPWAARRLLSDSRMDETFFALKRAYHGTLRIGRKPLAEDGLTAARFDLLFALTEEGQKPGPSIYQSALRRILGVTRPTVSRMLISLEKLGLIQRHKSLVDRRQLDVELTESGWSRIRGAFERLTESAWAFGRLAFALSGVECDVHDPDDPFYAQLNALDDLLEKLRRGFRDFATLRYPPMPND